VVLPSGFGGVGEGEGWGGGGGGGGAGGEGGGGGGGGGLGGGRGGGGGLGVVGVVVGGGVVGGGRGWWGGVVGGGGGGGFSPRVGAKNLSRSIIFPFLFLCFVSVTLSQVEPTENFSMGFFPQELDRTFYSGEAEKKKGNARIQLGKSRIIASLLMGISAWEGSHNKSRGKGEPKKRIDNSCNDGRIPSNSKAEGGGRVRMRRKNWEGGKIFHCSTDKQNHGSGVVPFINGGPTIKTSKSNLGSSSVRARGKVVTKNLVEKPEGNL